MNDQTSGSVVTNSVDHESDEEIGDPRLALRVWVRRQVGELQARYRDDDSAAVARLAVLRRANLASPALWASLGSLPATLVGNGDEPSRGEIAAGHSLQLFALHQQSRRTKSMHAPDARLGVALRRISGAAEADPALVRRFQAMSQSSTIDGCVHHLRGLVGQLRAAEQPLDYGLLAVDLWDFQSPGRRNAVRLRWSRGFYTYRPPRTDATDPPHPHQPGS